MKQLEISVEQSENNSDIDSCLSNFIKGIDNICVPLFSRKTDSNVIPSTSGSRSSLFDETCKDERKSFYTALNNYRKYNTEENKDTMIRARSIYKRSVRSYNYHTMNERTDKLINAKYKNAKEYWKLLKDGTTHKNPKNISLESFTAYFEAIKIPMIGSFSQTKTYYTLTILFYKMN